MMNHSARIKLLGPLLGVAIVESFIHYADNTIRYEDYVADDPTFPASIIYDWTIPISWVLFTIAAFMGYRRFREARWPEAAAWIGAYSGSGLVSILHFVDISVDDLSLFQNVFVFGDIVLGVLILAFAVWTAVRPPTPADQPSRVPDPRDRVGERS